MKKSVEKRINWKVLSVCFLALIIVSLFGSMFTTTGDWYENVKPTITPPNYVFPIAWTILYILIAISLYFVWINSKKYQKKLVLWAFGINLIANALWSYLFFGLQNSLAGLIDIIIIWLSIILILFLSYKIDKKAFYMLIPYFLWVSFAGYLNYLIYLG